MVHVSQLPCNGDGMCMQCKDIPVEEEKLNCKTCATPWHVVCLACPPESLASTLHWECPDCTGNVSVVVSGQATEKGGIVAEILAIEADVSLTEGEKARRRQELMSGKTGSDGGDETKTKKREGKGKEKMVDGGENDELDIFDGNLKCACCINRLERPVTVRTVNLVLVLVLVQVQRCGYFNGYAFLELLLMECIGMVSLFIEMI